MVMWPMRGIITMGVPLYVVVVVFLALAYVGLLLALSGGGLE
jgi:hypothetical protein